MVKKTPENYLQEPYAFILTGDKDSGMFSAEVLEFPGCFAYGDNEQEAIAKLKEIAKAWIEIELERGHDIPPPSADLEFAGKIALRLPRSLHRRAVMMAERDGTSLNQFLLSAISERVGAHALIERLIEKLKQPTVYVMTQLQQANITISISGETHSFETSEGPVIKVFPIASKIEASIGEPK